ncbi:MAG TPA: hypothetical protein ENN24_07310, partial [Bacteroidetes bacterium]|nr:hypothetical protein [Bacteroidota bacterium]
MRKLFTFLIIALIRQALMEQEVITQWTFAADGDLTSNNGIGAVANLIGGTTEVSQVDALRVTNFPEQFEASGTAGIQLMLSTEGYENISMTYKGRTSGTMSRWAEIQYTIDGEAWFVLCDNNGGLFPRDEFHDFSFDFSEITGANDNENFGIRIVSIFSPIAFNDGLGNEFEANEAYQRSRDSGGDEYSGTGNWRFQDVTIRGDQLTTTEATKLSITSINNGNPIIAGGVFSISIQALDVTDAPTVVSGDTEVNIILETGTGQLSGNLNGTIKEGTSAVTISGILYDTPESGVSVVVAAVGLDSATSETFTVLSNEGVIHYWHFNTLSGTVNEVFSDFSINQLSARITYPGTGDGYMDERTHRPADPVSDLNLHHGQEPEQGAVLRVRNPANTRELLLEVPTTGFKDIEVAFAITRTSSGAQEQEFYYSTDGGSNWDIVGEAYTVP